MEGATLRTFGTAAFAALALSGCLSAGDLSTHFADPAFDAAYIPLVTPANRVPEQWGVAVVVAPNVAVTNDHLYWAVPEGAILGRSTDYDLLFFRTDRVTVPKLATPSAGEAVIAYGQNGDAERREVQGAVRDLNATWPARCVSCPVQHVIGYDAAAGPGFSGGPVVDTKTGALLGITLGYRDGAGEGGWRRMYAYDIQLVLAEMRRLGIADTR